jgi:hypothetical protein
MMSGQKYCIVRSRGGEGSWIVEPTLPAKLVAHLLAGG